MKTITINVPDDCEVQIVKKEEEKKPVIRTYQDLIDNSIKISGYWINYNAEVGEFCRNQTICPDFKDVATSEKIAKSMLAMAMISQLMPYYGGEITDEEWKDSTIPKYRIVRTSDYISVVKSTSTYSLLSFHTEAQRDNFLKYNRQLVKDYLMFD